MELRHLRYFLAVAEEAHFRRAAETLFVSQPTLSLQVQDLERELGTPLFDRIGRRVRLTQAGELFRDYARRTLAVVEEGRSALDEIDGMLRGSLAIGAVQTINAYMMPPVIAQFAARYPKVRLRIEQRAAGEIEAGVLDGTLDLGVSFLPPRRKEILSERLFDEEFVLAVPPGHRFEKRTRLKLLDLAGEPLCLLGQEFCARQIVEEAFRRVGTSTMAAVEMNSVEGVIAVVESGGPATILPALALKGRTLRPIRLERPTPRRTVTLMTLAGSMRLRARETFREMLQAQLRSPRPQRRR